MPLLLAGSVFAELVDFNQYSDPAGIVSNVGEAVLSEWTNTVTAPASAGAYRFYGWLDQYTNRYADGNGAAENPAPVLILEAMTLTAGYVDEDVDADADTIPDWYELFHYGDTNEPGSSDTDDDGYTLDEEWYRGYDPHLSNALLYRVVERGDPTNLFDGGEQYIDGGSNSYRTATRYGEVQGCRFTHWALAGARYEDTLGRARDPIDISLVSSVRVYEVVAHFEDTVIDTDVDDVPDWYELHHYGDLDEDGTNDLDGDGWDLTVEAAHDTHPGLLDTICRYQAVAAMSSPFDFGWFPAEYTYSELSDPPGIISNAYLFAEHSMLTSLAQDVYTDMRFTYWTLNGVPQTNSSGAAVNPFVFQITTDSVGVAHLVQESQDGDADTVPDWYELHHYGHTNLTAAGDTDGDGYSLYEEWYRGYDPHVSNALVYRIVEESDPTGLFAKVEHYWATSSNAYTTASRYGDLAEKRFGYWSYNGSRFVDAVGRALDPCAIPLSPGTCTYELVATYLDSVADTDVDSVPDWYEQHHYGALDEAGTNDLDADGWDLVVEAAHDTHPGLADTICRYQAVPAVSESFELMVAADCTYTELSDPAGIISNESVVAQYSMVTSLAQDVYADMHFTYWALNAVPQADSNGAALNPIVFEITTDSVGVAYYVSDSQDADADRVPDWYELRYYGTTNVTAATDTDGDGYTLGEEWYRGYDPHVSNALLYRVVERSEPTNLFAASELYVDSSSNSYRTTSRYGDIDGTRFSHWTCSGVRYEDGLGRAADPAKVGLVSSTCVYEVIAHYLDAQSDTDTDSVPDWYELHHYGNLDEAGTNDVDGDGWDLVVEAEHDTHPGLADGIFRYQAVSAASDSLTFWQRFYFETQPMVLVDGTVTNLFGTLPPVVGALDLTTNSAPAVGDWDGDGDLDLFVVRPGTAPTVYENAGSVYTFDLTDRSSMFTPLGNAGSAPTVAMGDWGGDGFDDLAIGYGDGRVRIVSSFGSFAGWSAPSTDYDLDTGVSNAIPTFSRMVGQTNLSLLVLTDDGAVMAYTNTGTTAPFAGPAYTNDLLGTPVPNGTGLASADVDYDGLTDVLVSDTDGRIWVFYGRTNGTYELLSKVWSGSAPGFADRLTLAVGDLDGDTDIDMIGGYAEGGLVRLADPRLAPPLRLVAFGGAGSVRLQWEPNREQDLDGYFVYRTPDPGTEFVRWTPDPVTDLHYLDTNVLSGATYFYRVTAVSDRRALGSSSPRYVESRPSNTASGTCDRVVIWMSDYRADTNSTAVLRVNINHATDISGTDLDIRITYDTAVMKPLSQVAATNATVERTVLSQTLVLTNNATIANGELTISGSGGAIAGEGHILDVNFHILATAVSDATTTNTFSYVYLEGPGGTPLVVDYSDVAVLTVTAVYSLGDVSGDGILDQTDFSSLVQMVAHGVTPTPEQLAAGDLNGNGVLDHKDAQLLKRVLQGKKRNP